MGMRKLPGLVVVVSLVALGLFGASSSQAVQIGDRAPTFSLLDLTSRTVSLSFSSGDITLLFFMGYNADVCNDPASQIETQIYEPFRTEGVQVYGIDCWDGTVSQLSQFRDQNSVQFPLLLAGSSTASAYDLPYGSYVVIDAKGVVRYVSAGPSASAFDLSGLQSIIKTLLEEASATRTQTWGTIKTLYGQKSLPNIRSAG